MSEHLDCVIQDGLVVTGKGIDRCDLGIKDGKVAAVAPKLAVGPGTRCISAVGQYVLPGLVDVHVHPVYLDDLGSVSVSAAHGGVTTLIHYAYVRPGQDILPVLEQFRCDGLDHSVIDFGLHGGLFDVEHQLAQVSAAFQQGITSFKVFMTYAKLKWMTNDYWLTALLDTVARHRGLVMIHAENGLATDYLEDKYLREGYPPAKVFTAMCPAMLEAEAINRAMSLAQVTGCALYVPHISAEACLEPLHRARAKGWPVYAETCPQYLTLTEETTLELGPLAKIGPPLRTGRDNQALWQALADGTLSVIASDHAPKAKRREDDFFQAPFGSPQIETMLAMVYHAGINGGKISLPRLVQLMSEMPAKLFGLYPQKGTLQMGSDADLVIFDPTQRQALSVVNQHSHATYTLYEGREVTGAPILTMQNGEVIIDQGHLMAQPGRGRFLPTNTSHLYE